MFSQMVMTHTQKQFKPTLSVNHTDGIAHGQVGSFIKQECVEIPDLIDRLLQLSRLQAGTMTVETEPCQISDIFQASVPHLEAIAPNHRLCIDISHDILPVMASPNHVGEILMALVENAAKYSPEGSTISITVYRQNSFIQINVADQGIGIPADKREQVFEAYLQPEYQMSGGAGLGLAIGRALAELQGGEMWVSDRSRKGFHTTLSFTLPIVTAANWNSRRKGHHRETTFITESLLAEPYLMPV
jgi:K+-sensing histidine kinase KdpD